MKIGFVGLGKLGMPCALAAAAKGHSVLGIDPSPHAAEILQSRRYPYKELKAQETLENTTLALAASMDELVAHSEIVFCAVQTPHDPRYEGITRVPPERKDFDYSALRQAVQEVEAAAARLDKHTILAVISTVLPGTSRRELLPLCKYVRFVYNPFFIAMGTTIWDYLDPEFVLLGVDDSAAAEVVEGFYRELTGRPIARMSVASAELTKVLYNTFIGLKITMANTAMQICQELGQGDVDDVMGALGMAHRRLISPRYLKAGMGDGGGCHPRDNIALSWLSERLGLGYDLFGHMMDVREKQTAYLAGLALAHARGDLAVPARADRRIVILGKAFKPETNITTGSPAVLLATLLREQQHIPVVQWDPEVDSEPAPWAEDEAAVFVLATAHPALESLALPPGSVMIDPWGSYRARPDGVQVVRVGRE